jgi:hypothetical protein
VVVINIPIGKELHMKPVCKIDPDGTQYWYLNGKHHREDGPAVIYPSGRQVWYLNGNIHREDGPAVIHPNGTQLWYLNGNIHREDGPAFIDPDGTQEWWLNDNEITDEVNDWAKERNIDLNNTTSDVMHILQMELKMMFKEIT